LSDLEIDWSYSNDDDEGTYECFKRGCCTEDSSSSTGYKGPTYATQACYMNVKTFELMYDKFKLLSGQEPHTIFMGGNVLADLPGISLDQSIATTKVVMEKLKPTTGKQPAAYIAIGPTDVYPPGF